jgi:hypothetical protein
MSQSTIYQRNLRRLARSQQNFNDNRLPAIRVMSALPLLGYFFPKLQGNQINENFTFPSKNAIVEIERDSFSSSLISNDQYDTDYLSLALAGFAGVTMLASSYCRNVSSSVPIMLYTQTNLGSAIQLRPTLIQRMRITPTCCGVLLTASIVARSFRSAKSTVSKL